MSILDDLYNAFDPSPLAAGDPVYVDCKAVRGGSDVFVELGKKIWRSNQPTCQLYTGHRGGGKSTELLRLAQHLEERGCVVVYFSAEDEDINTEDVEYTDILLACTRHLLEKVKAADPQPVLSWLRHSWKALADILQTDVSLDDTKVEVQVQQFARLTTQIRTQPTLRAEIREKLRPYTENLVRALNEFIADAQRQLPADRHRLVVIADGLEKITLISKADGRTNHDEIFIDRSTQLKGLDCHIIYTVPVSLVLSSRAADLLEIYGCAPQVLPMVQVRTVDNAIYPDGMKVMRQIVRSRVDGVPKGRGTALEAEIFDSAETVAQLCQMTGGHVRNLMVLVRAAIDYNIERLPITAESLQQAIRQLRRTYRDTPNDHEWALLARVHRTKRILNDDAHRSLLFRRCVLEYRDQDCWHDVHPVLEDVPEFREAIAHYDQVNASGAP